MDSVFLEPFHKCAQPTEDLGPAAMAGPQRLRSEPGMCQTHGCYTIVLFEIDAHEACRGAFLPIRQPGEDEQARPRDLAVFSGDRKRLSVHSETAHDPLAAGAQIGFHMRGLKRSFCAPPLHRSSGLASASKT